jgi:hypothetical protein
LVLGSPQKLFFDVCISSIYLEPAGLPEPIPISFRFTMMIDLQLVFIMNYRSIFKKSIVGDWIFEV